MTQDIDSPPPTPNIIVLGLIGDIHRIGGGAIENLRLKPAEQTLNPPGISVLKNPTPKEAADQMRRLFPRSQVLQQAASTIGSTTEQLIRDAGFEIIHNPTRKLPNHYRIIHPEGVAGFSDENLTKLTQAFTNTTGN